MSEEIYANVEEIERDDSTREMRTMDVDHDLYGNVDTSEPNTRYGFRGQRSVSLQRKRRPFRAAAACLGLLCVLLLAGIIGQALHYREIRANLTEERDQLQTSYNNLTAERDQLKTSYNNLTEERDQLKTSYNNLTVVKDQLQSGYNNITNERDQLQIRYNNMSNERDQLQGEVERLKEACRQGWRRFGCSCYYVSSEEKTWEKSREFCKENGGDLVVINSREEQIFINGLYGPSSEVWIGLTDRDVEGTWTWVDGTPLTTKYWDSGQPNSHKGQDQDCGEFWHRDPGQQGVWNDRECNHSQNWICEK